MYSLQKLIPNNNNKPVFKPGAFSLHQKTNQSVDHSLSRSQEQKVTQSVDVNQQSLLQLQAQIQILQKKTPGKYKSEQNLKNQPKKQPQQQELLAIIENAKNKQSLSPQRRKIQTPKQKSNRKLNFNQMNDNENDNQFLNTSNAMANMIIENILNKDEHYERIRQENQELKDNITKQQNQINDLKKKQTNYETQIKELSTSTNTERQRYQNELLKINEKIQTMKTMQSNLLMEQKKNELLTKQLQESINSMNILKGFITENCVSCIDFLNHFQKLIISFHPQQAIPNTISLFKHSTSIILQTISKTQALNLPTLKNCVLPEEFDVNGFFDLLEGLQRGSINESPELSFRQKSHSLSQVGNKQTVSSKNVSLQDQFNTFLEQSEPILEDCSSQLGSPYFTNLDKPMKLQDRFKMQMEKEKKLKEKEKEKEKLINEENEKEKRRNQMPMQMQMQNKNKKNLNLNNVHKPNQFANFQSFNQIQNISLVQEQSELDTLQYDSLIKELGNNNNRDIEKSKDRSSSVHNLKYLDMQIQKEEEKLYKKNKENIQVNQQFVIAKYDYKAQKDVDLSFRKGDKIKLLKKTNNGWWYGEDNNNSKGYFPHNFVQLVD